MSLNGRSLKRLTALLVATFPTAFDLREFVRTWLDLRLPELTDAQGGIRRQAFELIEHLEARCQLPSLLFALRRARPGHLDVAALFADADFSALLIDCASPDEVDALLNVLPPGREVDDRLHAAVPPDLLGVPTHGTRDDLVWHLAELPCPARGVPRLLEFALGIELLLAEHPARAAIEAWGRTFALRHSVSSSSTSACRGRWKAAFDDRLLLLVVVHEEDGGRFSLRAWLRRESIALGTHQCERIEVPPEPVALEAIPAAVDELLCVEPIYSLLCASGARLQVELILPMPCLIPSDVDLPWAESSVAQQHDLVLRWRDRVYWNVKALPRETNPVGWRRKWANVQKAPAMYRPEEVWVLASEETASVSDALDHDARTAFAVHTPLVARRAHRNRLIAQALHRGVPVMVWLAEDSANPSSMELVTSLLTQDPSQARDEVMRQRRALATDVARGARAVNLVWDNPDQRPPDATPDDLAAPLPSHERRPR